MFCPWSAGAARSTSSYNGPAGALETDAEPKKIHTGYMLSSSYTV